jgi:hypothetical protein
VSGVCKVCVSVCGLCLCKCLYVSVCVVCFCVSVNKGVGVWCG